MVYDLLFKVSAETMVAIAADPGHLGARIGITSVLHSWGSALIHHPLFPLMLVGTGRAFTELRRFEEALVAGKKALRQNPSLALAYGCLVSAIAHLGRDTEAREAAAHLLETDPAFTISARIARGGQSNEKLLIDGLRKAGSPE